MKVRLGILLLLMVMLGQESQSASAEAENDGDLSPSEIALCRSNGCFGQSVSQNIFITKIGPESVSLDRQKNKFLSIPVIAKANDFTIEYTILQWIGTNKVVDEAKTENAHAFARKLEEKTKLGIPVNLVVRGSANQMTAEFILLGFFTGKDFFFLDRVAAPLLKDL